MDFFEKASSTAPAKNFVQINYYITAPSDPGLISNIIRGDQQRDRKRGFREVFSTQGDERREPKRMKESDSFHRIEIKTTKPPPP